VSGGVLELAAGAQLGSTTQVTVNAGGTLLFAGTGSVNTRVNDAAAVTLGGGTISAAGLTSTLDEQFGVLTLSQTSTLDLSLLAAGNTLRFANSAAATWSAGQTLKIYNYTSGVDHIFVGGDSVGLTTAQLNAIEIYSDAGITLLNSGFAPQFIGGGELSPVTIPEPSGLLLALGLAGVAGWRENRRGATQRRVARIAFRLINGTTTNASPVEPLYN
jgi:hypothetical protein